MPITREEILVAAKAMTPAERDELIKDIYQIYDEGEFTPEQLAEVRRRAAAVDSGEMQTIPGDQVMRELFERLNRAKAG